MIKPFEYHAEAIAEAREAYCWYSQQREEAADRFWQELVRTRVLITEQPLVWTPYFHNTRVFQLKGFPYGLVYVEQEKRIVGLAICHLGRRPGYWLGRKESK